MTVSLSLSASSSPHMPFHSYFRLPSKASRFRSFSVLHSSSVTEIKTWHVTQHEGQHATLGVRRWHVDVIPPCFLEHPPGVYFCLQKGQHGMRWECDRFWWALKNWEGWVLCIHRWVDGWMMGEERKSVWRAERYTSRCHESIKSCSPAELYLFTYSSLLTPGLLFTTYTVQQNNICKIFIIPFANCIIWFFSKTFTS